MLKLVCPVTLALLLAGCHLIYPFDVGEGPSPDGDLGHVGDSSQAPVDQLAAEGYIDGGQQTCDQKYGSAPGFIPCSEDVTQCSFYFSASGTTTTSCDLFCTSMGGTCIHADDAKQGTPCTTTVPIACDLVQKMAICTCTL